MDKKSSETKKCECCNKELDPKTDGRKYCVCCSLHIITLRRKIGQLKARIKLLEAREIDMSNQIYNLELEKKKGKK